MATFKKFDSFPQALATAKLNLETDTLKVMLTNTEVSGSMDSVFADLTEISAGNGYSAGGGTAANNAGSHDSTGLYSLSADDVVFTGSGGSFGPFQYAVLYSDTATNKDLIGFWDYGSSITVNDTETFTVDFGATVLTIQ